MTKHTKFTILIETGVFKGNFASGIPTQSTFPKKLMEDENEEFIQRYVNLSSQYTSKNEIVNEQISEIKQQIKPLADKGS